jgi:AmmeMemoRadiSam system protein A
MGGDDMSERRELSAEARTWLLALARQVIAHVVADRDAPATQEVPAEVDVVGGCFVSLHTRAGALRGCIGTFSEGQPLWHAVRDMAIAAATRDPRFRPLSGDELEDCLIEISALSPRQPATPQAVEVGRHGLLVARDEYSGVLLPQVATDQGWDRETFLDQTCLKARLPAEAWRDGSVTIETFTAQVFSEPD